MLTEIHTATEDTTGAVTAARGEPTITTPEPSESELTFLT